MSMPPLFRIGEILRGKDGTYTITKEIQEYVWLAKNYHKQETVVVKSVLGHPRVENECDVLRQFQHRTPYLRPMIDEVVEPSTPVTIVLKHFQSDLLDASIKQTLSRKELKYISRQILEASRVLHSDGYVHTDVKPDNVFVNFQEGDMRFSDVRLGDLGGCHPAHSDVAKAGTLVGAPIWSSPEVILEMPWNTAADIWSYGAFLISLIYGGDFNLFRPEGVTQDHEEYLLGVLSEQFQYFASFPAKFAEIASPETVKSILYLMQAIPFKKTTPFPRATEREVGKDDKVFIGKIMRLDWRDRPTATELLADEWWAKDGD